MPTELFTLFLILDYFGTFVFAFSGAIAGLKNRLDLFGVIVIAIITANGGGVLRSVATGNYPITLLQNPLYIILCILAAIIVFVKRVYFLRNKEKLVFFDALGLGVFFTLGTTASLASHVPWWASIILGTLSATFGGVLRDIICNQKPLLFQKELYATVCIVGGIIFLLLLRSGVGQEVTMVLTTVFIICLRMFAVQHKLHLPS